MIGADNQNSMVEVKDIREIQKHLYNLLSVFHDICEKNNLYYCVFGGTLLGAVRHEAIIPWDDDIDVCMPRKDYERFCNIVNEKYSEKYAVKIYPQDGYVYYYAKFCLKDSLLIEKWLLPRFSKLMLYIDVFPIDGYPPLEKEKKHFDKLRKLKKRRCKSSYKIIASKTWWKKPYVIVKAFEYPLYRLIGYKHFIGKEIEESKKYDFESSEYVSMQGAGWCERGKLKKEILMHRKLYKFGDLQVWGISDYDEHLTKLYGDYMTPPPKEKRVSNHNYNLFVKGEKNNGE